MKKIFLMILVVLCLAFSRAYATPSFFQEQKFISHQVKAGETISSISTTYNISKKEIYRMNPEAKSRIYEGLLLVLPSFAKNTGDIDINQNEIEFVTHKVKRNETLYSLSKLYSIPINIIKKYNTQLYNNLLLKGDKIKIPTNYTDQIDVNPSPFPSIIEAIPEDEAVNIGKTTLLYHDTVEYIVKAKETKYSISRKYGIPISQLEKINPNMKTFLTKGSVIQVPVIEEVVQTKIDKSQYYSYEVKKGNTMYSLLKQFNIKQEDLISLNPNLINGLKTGMVLTIPKEGYVFASISEDKNRVSLIDSITDYSVKNIAVMLPFGVNRTKIDTVGVRTNMLKNDRILRLSLDFHSGLLMAIRDAEKFGIASKVTVYDTEYDRKYGKATNARKVENIIKENDFSEVDAVIGPLLGGNVDRAASLLVEKNIPVISPITQRVSGGVNVFQSRPNDNILREKMFKYLETQDKEQNVIIIADFKNRETKLKLKTIFPNAKEIFPREGDNGLFLNSNDIPSKVLRGVPNLIILETNDIPMISQVTTDLNTLFSGIVGENFVTKYDITLATTYKGKAYESDEIQHVHLMNLNFHFPSITKEFSDSNNPFVKAYKTQHGITPSTEAIRGYDIMMDTLLRLGYAQDLFQSVSSGLETQYIENKFQYSKSENGFYNTAAYIMKYEENLILKEVQVTPDKDE